ncbi:hypothetical protein GPECTOR_45g164 [Gonium pectorale]|uniref:Plant heme peroxidase family profile domain-containing protein n=1 Tax=Gonium pectorale TaxID=33097 RepID=A0A150G8Y1_GONPE|nr:hypothetical protein GPECTOR_45g164 [Gonium pectorale]|eukprot:KXZ46294.1 hypothetical protein GPECTOR_45g164 [Gonium pectorale]
MRQAAFTSSGARRAAAPPNARAGRARSSVITCSLARDDALGRRQLLSAAGAAVLAAGAGSLVAPAGPALAGPLPQASVPVDQLGLFQKQAQLKEFRTRAEAALKEVIGAADAPTCMRLLINDALPYDAATKTGGVDGSIVLPEELARPENAGLAPLVEKLAQAKAKIDAAGAEDGSGAISWADTIVLAAKVATQAEWARIKINRAQIASGGETIAGPAFGAAWPVRLGRVDATTPAPAGKVLAPDASVAEIKATFAALAVKPGTPTGGLFATKPPFWERPTLVLWAAAAADPAAEEERLAAADPAAFQGAKVNYERSRRTVTRTDYEVDFIDYFTLLTGLATFKPDAYLHPEQVVAVRF